MRAGSQLEASNNTLCLPHRHFPIAAGLSVCLRVICTKYSLCSPLPTPSFPRGARGRHGQECSRPAWSFHYNDSLLEWYNKPVACGHRCYLRTAMYTMAVAGSGELIRPLPGELEQSTCHVGRPLNSEAMQGPAQSDVENVPDSVRQLRKPSFGQSDLAYTL